MSKHDNYRISECCSTCMFSKRFHKRNKAGISQMLSYYLVCTKDGTLPEANYKEIDKWNLDNEVNSYKVCDKWYGR